MPFSCEIFYATSNSRLDGKAFEPVLLAAGSFSMRYMPEVVFNDGKPRSIVQSELRIFT